MDKLFWILLAIVAGVGLPIQAGLNSKLAKAGGSPLHAAMISFTVGMVLLFLFLLFTSQNVSWKGLKQAPTYAWIGGLFGAFYVSVIIYSFPKIGPGLAFGLIVFGQLVMSLFMEHFQILGAQPQPINFGKIIGLICIIAGVFLIKKF